jgi:hypothetical protein
MWQVATARCTVLLFADSSHYKTAEESLLKKRYLDTSLSTQ